MELRSTSSGNLKQADGNPLKELGTTTLELQLGDLKLDRDVTVADIQDHVLLGLDIGKSIDVLTSCNKVIIDGHYIPAIQVKPDSAVKVRCVRDVCIPSVAEMIIEEI